MKILFMDIETAPNIAYVWGLFDQNIAHNQVEASSYVLCWSAKWSDNRTIMFRDKTDKCMLQAIHALLDLADIVVHYNGCKFDIPTLNKEFVKHGMLPPAPYKQVDLLQVCRRAFRFESNKLVSVVKALGLGQKLDNHGFELWVGCMKGDAASWKKMQRYNRMDVTLLERLYHRLLPWITRHPHVNLLSIGMTCPKCGSSKTQRRGVQVALMKQYARYQCQSCGGWFRSNQGGRPSRLERGISL